MANRTEALVLQMSADIRRMEKALNQVRGTTNRQLKGVEDRFAQMNSRLKSQAGALAGILGSAFAILGTGAGIGQAIRTMAEFAQAMSTVKGILSATEEQMVALTAKAKELGANTRFTATQAAEGMIFLARAGFNADQVLATIGGTLNLAQAGALDLGRAADIASNVLQGFRLKVAETNRVVDVMAKAANSTNTDINQLGDALKFVAPVAAGLGVSIEEATAAVGALSNAGLQASLAGTGLRRVLSELESPSSVTRRILKQLGLTTDQVRISQVGLTKAIINLKTAGLDTAQALEVFGDRGGPAFEVLSSSIPDLQRFTVLFENARGTAERMARTMDDNLNGALLAAASAWESLVLAIGDAGVVDNLTKSLRGLASVLRETSGALNDLSAHLRDLQAPQINAEKAQASLQEVTKQYADALRIIATATDKNKEGAEGNLKKIREETKARLELAKAALAEAEAVLHRKTGRPDLRELDAAFAAIPLRQAEIAQLENLLGLEESTRQLLTQAVNQAKVIADRTGLTKFLEDARKNRGAEASAVADKAALNAAEELAGGAFKLQREFEKNDKELAAALAVAQKAGNEALAEQLIKDRVLLLVDFQEKMDKLTDVGTLREVINADDLAKQAVEWLGDIKFEDELKGLRENMRDAVKEGFKQGLIDDDWGTALRSILAEGITSALDDSLDRLADLLTDFLFGSGGNSAGGIFSAIFSAFGGAKAGGGKAMAGVSYIGGERGQELFVPNVNGNVITAAELNRLRAGGAGGGGGGIDARTIIYGNVDSVTWPQLRDTLRANNQAMAVRFPGAVNATLIDNRRQKRRL